MTSIGFLLDVISLAGYLFCSESILRAPLSRGRQLTVPPDTRVRLSIRLTAPVSVRPRCQRLSLYHARHVYASRHYGSIFMLHGAPQGHGDYPIV